MSQQSKTVILLPALNEELAIGKVLEEIRGEVKTPHFVVVVDNGSTDRTAEIAREMGATVLTVKVRGKGNGVRNGIAALLSEFCPVEWDKLVMLDSDFTYPARYVDDVVTLLDDWQYVKNCDVVIGVRTTREEKAMTRINVLGNKVLSGMTSAVYGVRVRDVCSGLWGFRREALEKFSLTSSGFALEVDFLANAWRTGCRIGQIEIEYRARLDGSKAKLKVKDGLRIGWYIIRGRF